MQIKTIRHQICKLWLKPINTNRNSHLKHLSNAHNLNQVAKECKQSGELQIFYFWLSKRTQSKGSRMLFSKHLGHGAAKRQKEKTKRIKLKRRHQGVLSLRVVDGDQRTGVSEENTIAPKAGNLKNSKASLETRPSKMKHWQQTYRN